jgi:hypothetical protein
VQPASKHCVGGPDDWIHHHLVFSDIGTYEQAIAKGTESKWINLYYDPRYIIQQTKRNRAAAGAPEMTAALETLEFGKGRRPSPLPPPRPRPTAKEGVKKSIALTTEVQKHREKRNLQRA